MEEGRKYKLVRDLSCAWYCNRTPKSLMKRLVLNWNYLELKKILLSKVQVSLWSSASVAHKPGIQGKEAVMSNTPAQSVIYMITTTWLVPVDRNSHGGQLGIGSHIRRVKIMPCALKYRDNTIWSLKWFIWNMNRGLPSNEIHNQ